MKTLNKEAKEHTRMLAALMCEWDKVDRETGWKQKRVYLRSKNDLKCTSRERPWCRLWCQSFLLNRDKHLEFKRIGTLDNVELANRPQLYSVFVVGELYALPDQQIEA